MEVPLHKFAVPRSGAVDLIVQGAQGRVGSRIVFLARDDVRFGGVTALLRDAPAPSVANRTCVIVDFSAPSGVHRSTQLARDLSAALLVGTTGLSAENIRQLEETAQRVPVMIAPNTSVGVAILRRALAAALATASPERVEVEEWHHAAKRDRPSGTAHALLKDFDLRLTSEDVLVHREGETIGTHEIRLEFSDESVVLRHVARDRDVFAAGALTAAAWLATRKTSGLHAFQDALL